MPDYGTGHRETVHLVYCGILLARRRRDHFPHRSGTSCVLPPQSVELYHDGLLPYQGARRGARDHKRSERVGDLERGQCKHQELLGECTPWAPGHFNPGMEKRSNFVPLVKQKLSLTTPGADANIFYHLEDWKSNPNEPSTTLYLGEIQTFQRHLTTATFKLAGGVDIPSASNPHKPLKQHAISQEFLSNITKAFLETVYAFLDGLVHLASEESPPSHGHRAAVIDMGIAPGSNPLELLDLTETVSFLWNKNPTRAHTLTGKQNPSGCFKFWLPVKQFGSTDDN